MRSGRGRRWAIGTAVAGTVCIATGAFWLSFTSLTDLASRSGISAAQAWMWPLIVDGIIVVATVAVVTLAGGRSAWYPWSLLASGALVSVAANAIHAVVAADSDVPSILAASVAAVPPLVLLAITHLTVLLTRAEDAHAPVANGPMDRDAMSSSLATVPDRHSRALELRERDWTNKAIARELGVHPSTVGRWFAPPHLADENATEEVQP